MRKRIILAAAIAAIPLTTLAYTHGKPGLWEVTTQLNFTKGGPMAQIPPDKLAMMKQMGIQLPGSGQPFTTRMCVTPEQAAADSPPPPDRQHQCQIQNLKRDGHTFNADLVCNGDEMQGSGHMTVSYDGDEHYSGSMQFSGTSQHAGAVEMNNQVSGQWQGADCGTVKPFVMPKAGH
jgi:hypothetical protein